MKIVVWGSSHWFVETSNESHGRAIKAQSDVHYFDWFFYNVFQNVVSQAKEINTIKIVVDKQMGCCIFLTWHRLRCFSILLTSPIEDLDGGGTTINRKKVRTIIILAHKQFKLTLQGASTYCHLCAEGFLKGSLHEHSLMGHQSAITVFQSFHHN